MDLQSLIGLGSSFAAMAFGFGRQSSTISVLRRDVDNIGSLYRQNLELVSDIRAQLARIESRLEHLEEKEVTTEIVRGIVDNRTDTFYTAINDLRKDISLILSRRE